MFRPAYPPCPAPKFHSTLFLVKPSRTSFKILYNEYSAGHAGQVDKVKNPS